MLDRHSQFDPVFSVRLCFDMKSAQTQDTLLYVMYSERLYSCQEFCEKDRTEENVKDEEF